MTTLDYSPLIICRTEMEIPEIADCPFCGFSENEHYFLLQHVETVHPEGGAPSPFAVTDVIRKKDEHRAQESERALNNLSEYIECQCGEFCFLAEFENHLEMHYAEGRSLDEARSTNTADTITSNLIVCHKKRLSPRYTEPSLPAPQMESISGPSISVPVRSSPQSKSSTASRKIQNPVSDIINVLRHSISPPPKLYPEIGRSAVPQRLGVCLASSRIIFR